ncbi:MAG: class I SAM-dependent methyltransferase [Actinomycetota bacterium]|nr:class I SAM-dependent methyltransferase [Actinomycetota bacterium]
MPSIEWNSQEWGEAYDWSQRGDEWSKAWGGPHTQWLTVIWPRIEPFLPCNTLLEIAPGFGRWTQFLLPLSSRYVGVDLSERCVEACTSRFSEQPHAEFYQNDGRHLVHVTDGTVDFAFSFDSLVHVEMDVIDAYLGELAKKLAPQGVAFLHHSNLGYYLGNLGARLARSPRFEQAARGPRRSSPLADVKHSLFGWQNNRALGVSASRVADCARRAGLVCVSQELITWGTRRILIDCISTFARPTSKWQMAPRVRKNPGFMAAARTSRLVDELYHANRATPQ